MTNIFSVFYMAISIVVVKPPRIAMNAATRKRVMNLSSNLNKEHKKAMKVARLLIAGRNTNNQRKLNSLGREYTKIVIRTIELQRALADLKGSFSNAVRQEASSRRLTSTLRPFASRISNIAYKKGLAEQQAMARANLAEFIKNFRAPSPKRASPSPKRTASPPKNSGFVPRSPATMARLAELGMLGKQPNTVPRHTARTYVRLANGRIVLRTN
jgi:hypothetical protein